MCQIEDFTLGFYPNWITSAIGVAFGVSIFLFILVISKTITG